MATFLRQRTEMRLLGAASGALFTTYWDSTGAASTALATEAMARVRAFFNSGASLFPPGMTLTYNTVLDEIEETDGNLVGQVSGTAPAAVTFTGSVDLLPLQTQAVLRLQTGTFRDGRRLQGRIFVPYLKESSNSASGAPESTTVTALNAAATLLGTTVVTAMNQRVWSRPREATLALPARSGLSAVVIARATSASWGVLKSRRG